MLLPLHNNIPGTPFVIPPPEIVTTFITTINIQDTYSNRVYSNKNIDSSIGSFTNPSRIKSYLIIPSKVTFNKNSPHLFENNLH